MPSSDAEVTIGEFTDLGEGAAYTDQDSGAAVWADYQLRNRYEKDGHLYMMGNTSPDRFQNKSVSIVQLAHPTYLWIADWTCARFDTKPKIPDPRIKYSDWVLLDTHYDLGNLTVGADGSIAYYRISGTYFYGHLNPPDNDLSVLVWPRPPWLEDFFDRFVPVDLMETNLIHPTRDMRTIPNLDNPVILGDGRV